MTWEESDLLTWDERKVLLRMADKQTKPPAAATPAHVPATERLAQRTG